MTRFELLLLVALSGCRIAPAGGPPFTGSPNDDEPGAETQPPDPTVHGGMGAGGASSPRSGGEGGEAKPPPGKCDAQEVELDELRSGRVLSGLPVALTATATSQKFLVSQTQAGSCLWGAFFGEPSRDGEPRGLLVVSYGNEVSGAGACPTGTDAIFDDLAPGDRARITGRASSFAPSACDGVTPAPQMIADARCPLERVAKTALIEPVSLPLDVAENLAAGDDSELIRHYAGGLVRLEHVSALPNESGDGAVRPYGVLSLAETALEVHADIEYGDLGEGGPRDPSKSLDFPYPTQFRSITGLVYLDYCSYALAPRKRCSDFDPPSRGCP